MAAFRALRISAPVLSLPAMISGRIMSTILKEVLGPKSERISACTVVSRSGARRPGSLCWPAA